MVFSRVTSFSVVMMHFGNGMAAKVSLMSWMSFLQN